MAEGAMQRSTRSSPAPRGSRSAVVLADQIASNASNALLPILVAGSSTTVEFGYFAIAWAMSNFIVRVYRNGLGVQLSLLAGNPERLERETALSLTSALLLAPLSSVLIVLGARAGTGEITSVIVALALVSPVVLSQDLLRFTGIAQNRAVLVFVSDATWLGASLGALAWRILATPDALDIVLVWGAGAAIALAVLTVGLAQRPRADGLAIWARSSALPRLHLGSAALAEGAAGPIIAVLVGVIAGPEIVAAISGTAQLMAPVNTAVAFMTIGLLPRAAALSVPQKILLFRRFAAIVAAGTIVWSGALHLIPDRLGVAALGDTWSVAKPLITPFGVQYTIGVFAIAGTILLTSLGRTRQVLMIAGSSVVCRVVATALVAAWLGTATGIVLADASILLVSALTSALIAIRYRSQRAGSSFDESTTASPTP